jgi:hypothetical protein
MTLRCIILFSEELPMAGLWTPIRYENIIVLSFLTIAKDLLYEQIDSLVANVPSA